MKLMKWDDSCIDLENTGLDLDNRLDLENTGLDLEQPP
jgi:hypothetical protein